jgi:glycosyltransferase involved in cell wall biosynthesis
MTLSKKLGFVTLGANVPSTRFRFLPFQEPFKQRGHRCRLWTSYPSVYDSIPALGWRLSYQVKKANRWLQWADAMRFRPDTVYLERGCFHDDSLWMDERFRRIAPRLVLDVDDAIFLQFPDKVKRLIEMSDHVVVSNRLLHEYVSQYHHAITEVPTCVALTRYRPRTLPSTPPTQPIVGWIGTASNLGFLEECASALRRVARELPFTLLVVSNTEEPLRRIDLQGVTVRFERWSPETEIARLHEMDVGLMPLRSGEEWMRFKAATKLVQYMSIGIPAIATPIGVNADILEGNRVGFAASNEEEWVEALRTLIRDPELRWEQGRNGRSLVESRFCIEANLGRLERALVGTIPDE